MPFPSSRQPSGRITDESRVPRFQIYFFKDGRQDTRATANPRRDPNPPRTGYVASVTPGRTGWLEMDRRARPSGDERAT